MQVRGLHVSEELVVIPITNKRFFKSLFLWFHAVPSFTSDDLIAISFFILLNERSIFFYILIFCIKTQSFSYYSINYTYIRICCVY